MQVGHNPCPEHVGAWENRRGLKTFPLPLVLQSDHFVWPWGVNDARPSTGKNFYQVAPIAPSQQVFATWKSMLPTLSLCSIIWLNRGIKLRKVHQFTNTGQVWNRCHSGHYSSRAPSYRLLKMLLSFGWLPLLPSSPWPPEPLHQHQSLVTQRPFWFLRRISVQQNPVVAVGLGLHHLILYSVAILIFASLTKWLRKVFSTSLCTHLPRTRKRTWICCLETFWQSVRPLCCPWRTTRRAVWSSLSASAGSSGTTSAPNREATSQGRMSSMWAPLRWHSHPVSPGPSDLSPLLQDQNHLKVRAFSYIQYTLLHVAVWLHGSNFPLY